MARSTSTLRPLRAEHPGRRAARGRSVSTRSVRRRERLVHRYVTGLRRVSAPSAVADHRPADGGMPARLGSSVGREGRASAEVPALRTVGVGAQLAWISRAAKRRGMHAGRLGEVADVTGWQADGTYVPCPECQWAPRAERKPPPVRPVQFPGTSHHADCPTVPRLSSDIESECVKVAA